MQDCHLKKTVFGVSVAAFLLLFAYLPMARAAEYKPDIQAFAADIQRVHQEAGVVTMVFWFPVELWEVSLAANPRLTKEQVKEFLDNTRPYVIIAVVDGKFGAFGNMNYKSEAEVRKEIKFVDGKGNTYEPVGEEDLQDATKDFLAMFRPVMANMLGAMGKNMQLMLFRDKGPNSERLADPKGKGSFTVKLGKQEYRWKLPLGSVLPPKLCPKCKEKGSGNWEFCPWCGSQLGKNE